MDIARNIKALREHHNMSQSDLAKLLDVSDKAVSTWENGRREPRMGVIQKLALAFNLQISDIVEKDLETYYKSKTSPAPAKAEAGEITLEETDKLLVALGLIKEGEQISDDDLAFVGHIVGLLDAWFRKRK